MRQDLQSAERKASERVAAVRAEGERMQEELHEDATAAIDQAHEELAAAERRAEELGRRYEAARDELAHLRDKTRVMMEEKEEEVAALRRLARASAPDEVDENGNAGVAAAGLPVSTQRLASASGSSAAAAAQQQQQQQLEQRIVELEAEVRAWKEELADAERTAELREQAETALKDEIRHLQALQQAGGVDSQYLRSVLISGFNSGELPKQGNMYKVLARLLHFTSQEAEQAPTGAGAKQRVPSRSMSTLR